MKLRQGDTIRIFSDEYHVVLQGPRTTILLAESRTPLCMGCDITIEAEDPTKQAESLDLDTCWL